jgi:hypothetical protein
MNGPTISKFYIIEGFFAREPSEYCIPLHRALIYILRVDMKEMHKN